MKKGLKPELSKAWLVKNKDKDLEVAELEKSLAAYEKARGGFDKAPSPAERGNVKKSLKAISLAVSKLVKNLDKKKDAATLECLNRYEKLTRSTLEELEILAEAGSDEYDAIPTTDAPPSGDRSPVLPRDTRLVSRRPRRLQKEYGLLNMVALAASLLLRPRNGRKRENNQVVRASDKPRKENS